MRKSIPRTFQPQAIKRQRQLTGVPLAGFNARAWALVCDILLVSILVVAAEAIFGHAEFIKPNGDIDINVNPFHGPALILLVLYFALALYWGRGRTPGKRLLRIRVISLVHERMSFWHCVERAIGYGASLLEGGFGFIQFFIHPNRQTAHDRLAETIVIREPRTTRA